MGIMEGLSENFKTATMAIVQRCTGMAPKSNAVATPPPEEQDDVIVTWAKCMTYKLKRFDFKLAHQFMVKCDINVLKISQTGSCEET